MQDLERTLIGCQLTTDLFLRQLEHADRLRDEARLAAMLRQQRRPWRALLARALRDLAGRLEPDALEGRLEARLRRDGV